MGKKYLIDEEELEKVGGGYVELHTEDAKEVEVLDWNEIEIKFKQSQFLMFTQFARANNLLIVKIKD